MKYETTLPILGRDVQVGDLYNYFTDGIVKASNSTHHNLGPVAIPDEHVTRETMTGQIECSYFLRNQSLLIYRALNVNEHVKNSSKNGHVDLNNIWFSRAIAKLQSLGNSTAAVVAIIRITRRSATIRKEFADNSMKKYCFDQRGLNSTHLLVDHVAYGTELFVIIRKDVVAQDQMKCDAEKVLLAEAKAHLTGELFESVSSNTSYYSNMPKCTVFSSDNDKETECSLANLRHYLKNEMAKPCSDGLPIFMKLRPIPSQVDVIRRAEKIADLALDLYSVQVKMHEMLENRHDTGRNMAFWRKFALEPMSHSLNELEVRFNEWRSKSISAGCLYSDWLDSGIDTYYGLLAEVNEWLNRREMELTKLESLLGCTELSIFHLAAIEDHLRSNNQTLAKVFQLRCIHVRDKTLERVQEMLGHENRMLCQTSRLLIVDESDVRFRSVCKKLKEFSTEAERNFKQNWCYYIALTPDSSTLKDGEESWINLNPGKIHGGYHGCEKSSSFTSVKSYSSESSVSAEGVNYDDSDDECQTTFVTSEEDASGARGHESRNSKNPTTNVKKSKPIATSNSAKQNKNPSFDSTGAYVQSKTYSSASKFETTENDAAQKGSKLVAQFNQYTTESTRTPQKNTAAPSNRSPSEEYSVSETITRIKAPTMKQMKLPPSMKLKEMYVTEHYNMSKLVAPGEPNVFHLKASKRRQTEVNLRQFDIVSPADGCRKNHKVIILMGATGCGKSTLINGMVNYILGVEWSDPYRFKCVREDRKESIAVNQAQSQTRLVTSYTLHWHDGMNIPFSITIVDTPGYGDTRGVKRDKVITKRIHQFLTDAEIDEIHAVCFVATSGDSRLTATQRYVIDSVLSIFGKDVKDNIRLLVTFGDNLVPPVVEACKESNFPVTSKSGQIIYSKFNSSVLYACNGSVTKDDSDNDDDDDHIEEIFWNMGRENFKKFFDMLETMEGKDLTATRRVIESRNAIDQMLAQIEDELEVCLTKIENIEVFRTQLRKHGHNMTNTKNYVVERNETMYVSEPCKSGYIALNCISCGDRGEARTCKKTKSGRGGRTKEQLRKYFYDYFFSEGFCPNKDCVHSAHPHSIDDFEWRLVTKPVKTTLYDMKIEYESHQNRLMTTDQLLQTSEHELDTIKAKVFSLLDKVTKSVQSLKSEALSKNVLGPSDYLSLMKSKVNEKQAPGYMTRLDTLGELQNYLTNNDDSRTTKSMQLQTTV